MSRPLYPNLPHKEREKTEEERKIIEGKATPVFEQTPSKEDTPLLFKKKRK